ncbi:MAG: pseudaminic acid biosynthesis-associated methylase [Elainellaceae cyanobacterium]
MKLFKTEQEVFWAGEFGNEYVDRNQSAQHTASNLTLFSRILQKTTCINSVIELGANIGLNLQAIRQLLPSTKLAAVEINQSAVKQLKSQHYDEVYHQSILEFNPSHSYNLSLVKGVLIHIAPEYLNAVYDLLYHASDRYICIAEYYSPSPITISYRGHENKLFKRDFAGEILDRFQDVTLSDYGFVYHRDNNFPQDDITWFLFEKTVLKP